MYSVGADNGLSHGNLEMGHQSAAVFHPPDKSLATGRCTFDYNSGSVSCLLSGFSMTILTPQASGFKSQVVVFSFGFQDLSFRFQVGSLFNWINLEHHIRNLKPPTRDLKRET